MAAKAGYRTALGQLPLTGLTLAPPQVLGGIRLVPILRNGAPRTDLRLNRRAYGQEMSVVALDKTTAYYSYIPHGLVATWGDDASTFSTQIRRHATAAPSDGGVVQGSAVRLIPRMVKREGKSRARFLPLHIALEGYLAFHFNGPEVAWAEYSSAVKRHGLSPRAETAIPGQWIQGLDDALRIFEIHDSQVGVVMFVGDVLGSAFVVPHPEDYRALHRSLLTDFYGELLLYSGLYAPNTVLHPSPIDPQSVNDFADLRQELQRVRHDWAEFHADMAAGLFGTPLRSDDVYRFGPFRMERFVTSLDPKSENHIGEDIFSENQELMYLKSFRLSAAQTRRAHLLQVLAECDWDLDGAAAKFNSTREELILRIDKVGFGYLLHQHVIDGARSWRRRRYGGSPA